MPACASGDKTCVVAQIRILISESCQQGLPGGYGVKRSPVLIDTGTLADIVGEGLCNMKYTAPHLPRLMSKCAELEDFDMRMFPLLECFLSLLTSIATQSTCTC